MKLEKLIFPTQLKNKIKQIIVEGSISEFRCHQQVQVPQTHAETASRYRCLLQVQVPHGKKLSLHYPLVHNNVIFQRPSFSLKLIPLLLPSHPLLIPSASIHPLPFTHTHQSNPHFCMQVYVLVPHSSPWISRIFLASIIPFFSLRL